MCLILGLAEENMPDNARRRDGHCPPFSSNGALSPATPSWPRRIVVLALYLTRFVLSCLATPRCIPSTSHSFTYQPPFYPAPWPRRSDSQIAAYTIGDSRHTKHLCFLGIYAFMKCCRLAD